MLASLAENLRYSKNALFEDTRLCNLGGGSVTELETRRQLDKLRRYKRMRRR